MAGHELIERHLRTLAERLPGSVVDELADGLLASYDDQMERLGDPDAAARAALADFGDADAVTAAFVRASPARHAAFTLLVAGPIVGLCWGTALITADGWAAAIPLAARLAFGLLLGSAVLMLVTAVREQRHYHTVRLAALGGAGTVAVLDTVIMGTVVTLVPPPSLLLLVALTGSVARIMLAIRAIPTLITRL
ncbi:hypothetical protein FLW53_14380 [Microbispora sp. SCL1-1]|uniref:hypothetical protein n=1 Tax=unclassified Microbispora TaxID=2614687 RepID=UPI00115B6666|nr:MULTISPECIES: hypothetical protein [unclassified Microbispora]NJP25358.1 hypothetical protein [Microbispora sp. CL1-1]TQS13798.1 hypothetical protein FLW53_14380 [Microbispora sp. SCL1-1]